MIRNFEELRRYTQECARRLPEEFEHTIVVRAPGISALERERLKTTLDGVPESYLEAIEAVQVAGVAIGFFQLSALGARRGDLVAELIDRNASANPWLRLQRHRLLEVAALDADPICVARTDSSTFAPGTVVLLNSGNPTAEPRTLAPTFTVFLLVAASLDEARAVADERHDPEAGLRLFEEALAFHGVDSLMRNAWLGIASGTLGF